jgi:hypothetical protein
VDNLRQDIEPLARMTEGWVDAGRGSVGLRDVMRLVLFRIYYSGSTSPYRIRVRAVVLRLFRDVFSGYSSSGV